MAALYFSRVFSFSFFILLLWYHNQLLEAATIGGSREVVALLSVGANMESKTVRHAVLHACGRVVCSASVALRGLRQSEFCPSCRKPRRKCF